MVDNNRSLVPNGGGNGGSPVTIGSRVTGAIAGAAAGALLPIPLLGPVTGAVIGGIFGPKVPIVNTVSEKAVEQIGKWAGR